MIPFSDLSSACRWCWLMAEGPCTVVYGGNPYQWTASATGYHLERKYPAEFFMRKPA